MDFKKSFCFRSNLSNDDMISGLKSENGKMTIFGRKWGRGLKRRGAPPTKNSQDSPPPPRRVWIRWSVLYGLGSREEHLSRFECIQPILLGQTPHFAWNELNNSSTLVKYGVGQIWF